MLHFPTYSAVKVKKKTIFDFITIKLSTDRALFRLTESKLSSKVRYQSPLQRTTTLFQFSIHPHFLSTFSKAFKF